MAFTFHLPVPDQETGPFWAAAKEGRLVYQHCAACGNNYHYPRARCPKCWSDRVEWRDASGRGTVYTYSVIHENPMPPFRDRVPYVVGIVELDEGPRLMTSFADTPLERMEVGMPVQVVFETEGEGDKEVAVYRFRRRD